MRKGWVLTKLDELLEIQSGFAFDSKKFSDDGDIPLIRIRDLKHGSETATKYSGEYDAKYVVRSGDLLVGMDGEFACYEWKSERALLNQRVCRLQNFSNALLPRFLYHGINKFLKEIEDVTSFTTVKHLSAKKIASIEFPCPPLPEQERIVAILDEAFAGIDTAVANTEKNLANARELFESYLNAVFDQPDADWTQSSVGALVADGVIDKPLDGNHGEIHPKKSDFVDSGVPFLMAKDLKFGSVNQTSCHFITRKQASELRKGFAKDGDVLLSHKGTVGRCAVLATKAPFVVLTPQLTYYRVRKKSTLNNRFLYYFFQSPTFTSTLNHIAGAGSTRAYIGITRQLDLPISFPALEVQKSLAGKFDELIVESRRLEVIYQRKLTSLVELKQSLLQKAFAGELTTEATDEMEAALA